MSFAHDVQVRWRATTRAFIRALFSGADDNLHALCYDGRPHAHEQYRSQGFTRPLNPLSRPASGGIGTSARCGTHSRGRREKVFFHQGDAATAQYVVTAGQARLLQLAPDGNQLLLNYVSVGEMFGGIVFLGEATYPVSAQAVSDCTAATLDGETMARLMERLPRLAFNAMQHMAARIQELQDRVRELATERVERRIANTLVRLAQQTGKKTADGVLIDLPLSRQDIAEMTGTTLYTVSRTLSRWEQEGIVDAGRERVLIRFPHRLVAIAEDLPPRSSSKIQGDPYGSPCWFWRKDKELLLRYNDG